MARKTEKIKSPPSANPAARPKLNRPIAAHPLVPRTTDAASNALNIATPLPDPLRDNSHAAISSMDAKVPRKKGRNNDNTISPRDDDCVVLTSPTRPYWVPQKRTASSPQRIANYLEEQQFLQNLYKKVTKINQSTMSHHTFFQLYDEFVLLPAQPILSPVFKYTTPERECDDTEPLVLLHHFAQLSAADFSSIDSAIQTDSRFTKADSFLRQIIFDLFDSKDNCYNALLNTSSPQGTTNSWFLFHHIYDAHFPQDTYDLYNWIHKTIVDNNTSILPQEIVTKV